MRKAAGKMRTPLNLDDQLLAEAQKYTGIAEKTLLVREALKALVEREAGKRLVLLGGSDPDAEFRERRRRGRNDRRRQLDQDLSHPFLGQDAE
ncbi:MAG TPA: type II toxin-antitoxin system VapB family antitoxin [Mesorhizobium sp.]